MSTHNIGFYEEMAEMIFHLSSNTHFICSSGLMHSNSLSPAEEIRCVFYDI